MKLLIGLGLAAMTAFGAQASPCTTTNFSSANGDIYLKAEAALIQGGTPQRVLDLTDDLWASNLNCFERQSVRRLRAATFLEMGEYKSAIELLKPLAMDDGLPAQQRADTAQNIASLYDALGDKKSASTYAALKEELLND